MKRGVLALLLVGATAHARPTAYALAIGNNAPPVTDTGESLPTLRYSDDDATRYFQFFSRFADSTRLLSVLDADTQRRYPDVGRIARAPTKAELKAAIADFSARVRSDIARGDEPSVYIAFSGHGAHASDGRAFLALADQPLFRQELYDEVLAPLEAAVVHLFIDACHAEGVVGGRGDKELPQASVAAKEAKAAFELRLPARFVRVGALLATSTDQQAHEWSRIESGVFTHELLSALSGAADVNGDGALEYSEVKAFIAAANRDLADPRAVPQVVALAPRIDLHAPIVRLERLKGTGFLVGVFAQGRFFIELGQGQRALDAHLAADHVSTIALPAGRVFVVLAEGLESEFVIAAGQTVRVEDLKLMPRQDQARGALSATLSRGLFLTAFGATYYKGYVDSQGETSVVFSVAQAPSLTSSVRRREPAVAVLIGSAAMLGASIFGAVGAGINHVAYEQTNLQRPAFEARQRTLAFSVVSGVSGVLAIVGAIVGHALWPKQGAVSVQLSSGGAALVLSSIW